MSDDVRANPSMTGEETKTERHKPEKKEFGFIVEQTVTESTPLPEIEKSINNFFDVMGGILAQYCSIKKADIETRIHYNGRKKILEGKCFVPKATSEGVIDLLYYKGKAIWRMQPTEPYDFFQFTVDEPECNNDNDDINDTGVVSPSKRIEKSSMP